MEFDSQEVKRRLDEAVANPALVAQADQRRAELDEVLRSGTWFGALAALSEERGQAISYAAAIYALRSYISELPAEIVEQIAGFLMIDTVLRIAKYQHDDDVASAVASILTPEAMLNVEKFVATDGRACSFCGADEGWDDHRCDDDEQEQS